MAEDLKVALLSEPAGVELESCIYEGRTIFCAPPGDIFSIQITAKDPTKFRNMIGSDTKIELSVLVDGQDIGYVDLDFCPDNGTKFTYTRNKNGCYELKFKEVVDDSAEDAAALKANEAKQWDSEVGTITVEWKLYIQGELLSILDPDVAVDPLTDQAVGATKKFWQRPSAAAELGQPIVAPLFFLYQKTFIAGAAHSGMSTIWYHAPTVFAVFKNMSAKSDAAVAPVPVAQHNAGAIEVGKEVVAELPAPSTKAVEIMDLTSSTTTAACTFNVERNGVINLMDSDVEDVFPAKRARRQNSEVPQGFSIKREAIAAIIVD